MMTRKVSSRQLIIFALFFISSRLSYAFIAVSSPHQSKSSCARRRRSNDNDSDNDDNKIINRYHHHRTTTTTTTTTTAIRLQLRQSFGIDDVADDRFVNIRTALDRMLILQQQDGGEIMKHFQKCIQKVVSCRESSIQGAGQGLFATKNIKAGTVIGFYPVHGIGVDFNDDTSSSICLGITPEDQTYFDDENENANENNSQKKAEAANFIQYLIGSRKLGKADYGPDAQLFVNVNPDRIEEENNDDSDIPSNCWISHYINDGATVLKNSEIGMLDYYTESKRKKNCVHIPFGPAPIIATVTTKKVKKGEELFTSYGCIYWAESIINNEDEDGECVADITDAVQIKAKETAQDIFTAWKNSQTIHESQQIQLQESFEKI
jgi:hypothetical protein